MKTDDQVIRKTLQNVAKSSKYPWRFQLLLG